MTAQPDFPPKGKTWFATTATGANARVPEGYTEKKLSSEQQAVIREKLANYFGIKFGNTPIFYAERMIEP